MRLHVIRLVVPPSYLRPIGSEIRKGWQGRHDHRDCGRRRNCPCPRVGFVPPRACLIAERIPLVAHERSLSQEPLLTHRDADPLPWHATSWIGGWRRLWSFLARYETGVRRTCRMTVNTFQRTGLCCESVEATESFAVL